MYICVYMYLFMYVHTYVSINGCWYFVLFDYHISAYIEYTVVSTYTIIWTYISLYTEYEFVQIVFYFCKAFKYFDFLHICYLLPNFSRNLCCSCCCCYCFCCLLLFFFFLHHFLLFFIVASQ